MLTTELNKKNVSQYSVESNRIDQKLDTKAKSSNINTGIDTITLYEEYRLIEKDQSDVNVAWRGVHLLLFFLAFVFGSFCTFCFHMLMFLFDEKCVLFPKLISLKEMSKNADKGTSKQLIYDYISESDRDSLPVDFVATHWVEKKTCYLPTYAPLLSGICGLVWTTMFLMYSSGSRALTGLQKAWHILPTVFVFSLAMGGLSIYTSSITQSGLDELCLKLGEITGSKKCSYTINVATLAYERRIRGVYQATRLTIMSAWLHTLCWLGAAFTAILRIVMIADFRLVKVRVDLRGNIEKMLERHEKHIRTDEFSNKDEQNSPRRTISTTSLKVRFLNKGFGTEPPSSGDNTLKSDRSTIHFISQATPYASETALMPDESRKLIVRSASLALPKKYRFIVELLQNIVDHIGLEPTPEGQEFYSAVSDAKLQRQQGMRNIQSYLWDSSSSSETESVVNSEEAEQLAKKFRRTLEAKENVENFKLMTPSTLTPASSRIEPKPIYKSNSNRGVQTDEIKKQTVSQRVQINSPKSSALTLRPHHKHEGHKIKLSEGKIKLKEVPIDTRKPEEHEIGSVPTTDILKPLAEREATNQSTMITADPSKQIKSPEDTPQSTATLIPPQEQEKKSTEKVEDDGLLKPLVQYFYPNEDKLIVKPEPSQSEKESDQAKDRPRSPQELSPSHMKEEKPQEPGPSRSEKESDQEKDRSRSPQERSPSHVKEEKPEEPGLSRSEKDSDQEKDSEKNAQKLSPLHTKEEKSEEPGPSQSEKESDQLDEKKTSKEKPKKTDRKEKQD